uniref:Uncharacterized protein n=1 Tax=Globodera rostochiensis TaxID=31243 RepID=A0A914GRN6_GLORO
MKTTIWGKEWTKLADAILSEVCHCPRAVRRKTPTEIAGESIAKGATHCAKLNKKVQLIRVQMGAASYLPIDLICSPPGRGGGVSPTD